MTQPECPKCGAPMCHQSPAYPGGKPRWICRPRGEYCYSTTKENPTVKSDQAGRRTKQPVFKRTLGGATTLLITVAQNATPVHEGTLAALQLIANERSAELVVVPTRYRNPTSHWTSSDAGDDWYDDKLVPFLCTQRKRLNKNLVLLGDVKVQVTAPNPTSGFDSITHGESCILPHPKLEFRTVPTPQNTMPKILTTTGAITRANYSDTKVGMQGAFHHTLGAALVELQGKTFHLRQLNATSAGTIADLDKLYGVEIAGGIEEGIRAESLNTGDLHWDFADPYALQGTREQIELLRPKHIIWNDVDDAHTVSPHHRLNPFAAIAKVKSGRTDPEAELYRSIDGVASMTPADTISHIVFSNHPEMLARWIRDTDWKHQPGNAEFYLKTALMMAERTQLGAKGIETPDPFNHWGREYCAKRGYNNIWFLEMDESLVIAGIENGMHGHRGPNGAPGSLRNLCRLGVRTNIGHAHGPGIREGGFQGGTQTPLSAEYTAGPGSWLNTNIVTYETSKRSLLNTIRGNWRIR